jgi:hypothetical protein
MMVPASPLFTPIRLRGNTTLGSLKRARVSKALKDNVRHAPSGACTCWGIPFEVKRVVLARDTVVRVPLDGVKAEWLVFLHATDFEPQKPGADGMFHAPMRGQGRLSELAADYVFVYDDGTEERTAIRRRHQIGMIQRAWGELCFECVPYKKPFPIQPMHERRYVEKQDGPIAWGWTQTRAGYRDIMPWVNWVWPWRNPHPAKAIAELRIEPQGSPVIVSGLAAGKASAYPVRWETRRKAVLRLPAGESLDNDYADRGLYAQIQLDLGQIISVQRRFLYPNEEWSKTYNNQLPRLSERELLVEYTAHSDARFHVGGKTIPVSKLESGKKAGPLTPVAPATQRVQIKVVEKASKEPVPVKLHVHGEAGEYLAPLDRHRIPNPAWFEDYSCDFLNENTHYCTYIPGETVIDLPLGRVYLEVSKGFEIKPCAKRWRCPRAHAP